MIPIRLPRLLAAGLLLLPGAALTRTSASDAASDPLAITVLVQNGKEWSVRQVLEAHPDHDPTLLATLERDADYRRLYLDSPRFLRQVRAFADALLLDAADIPKVDHEAQLAEAAAWAKDHGQKTEPAGVLAANGLEIEVRARLLALQPSEFGTARLRKHMLASVPEFFHDMAISWIRRPLVDFQTGIAYGPKKRKEEYDLLAKVAQRIESQELSWDQAVEQYSLVPGDKERKGFVGAIRRTMVDRFEEPLLRQVFAGLGYELPQQRLLRGPILGDLWIYLVRIDTIRVRDVVDLNRVRDRVERSLREQMLRQKLAELRKGADTEIRLPISQ